MPTADQSWSWESWISSANQTESGFPLQNLPFCAFVAPDATQHLGVGIGDFVLDLNQLADTELLGSVPADLRAACRAAHLNEVMGQGRSAVTLLRQRLQLLLKREETEHRRRAIEDLLRPMERTVFCKPVNVANYTDFYASIHHATNVGRLFRPDQPLLPNYKFIPIGYSGRASSLVISGTTVLRPSGQTKPPSVDLPIFGPSRQLDYEIEVGAYIGNGNTHGYPIPIHEAEQHLFGVCLVNDWSARDIQAWEYQPLGPFLGKSFATSLSPWVVTMDALEPFRVPLTPRPKGDPEALAYLAQPYDMQTAIDIQLEVHLTTAVMRRASLPSIRLSVQNARDLYWTFAQLLTHHTSNGCNMMTGDLLASGTISGPEKGMLGSMLEITRRGEAPLHLASGETRTFLEDGDEVTLRGYCQRPGLPRISLGECRGTISPALA